MPAYFTEGFMVRVPAWHGLGTILDDYPGREEAMRLAGHNFTIIERPLVIVGKQRETPFGESPYVALPNIDDDGINVGDLTYGAKMADGWKALVKSMPGDESHGALLNVSTETYGVVQNDVPWDIVDAIIGEGVKYETGVTLRDGALCAVTAWLDEPSQIEGDDSPILPYLVASWTHDGSGAVSIRATSIRVVCANTAAAAEAEGKRLGTDFTFRHSKHVMSRIEDAKMAVRGVRAAHEEYLELARELAAMPVTNSQRELFVSQFLPMPPEALISDRVANNVEEARGAVKALFAGPTIPEAHRFTAYGLHLAGVEFLDHLRGFRNQETYMGRTLLRPEPAKAKLTKLIREVVAA
jgi:phage/plasmid-like protein (TIGR03299 family)